MRPSRVERTTTSCGECRRRKQKCNQGQPCSNCSRRFPPPPCEYKTINRRQLSPSNIVRQPAAFPLPPYPDNNPGFNPSGAFQPSSSSPYTLPLPSQWSGSPSPVGGEVVRWSGVNVVTRFPPSTNTPSQYPFENDVSFSQPSPTLSTCHVLPIDSVSHTGSTGGQGPPALLQNNPGMSDFFLLPDWIPHGFTEEALAWFTMGNFEQDLAHGIRPFDDCLTAHQAAGPPAPAPALTPSTQQADELLRIFVRTLAPFHAALDGVADPSHPYLRRYVPFILQSPLLCETSIYHSTGFLHDQGHMDKATMLLYKAQAISLFNSNVLSQPSPSDEIIAAHIQLTLNEWCWSDSTELGPHLRALKEMIRLRGGLQSLGLQCLIAKMAVTLDTSTSLSTLTPPILRPLQLSEPASSRVTANLRFNSPLASYFPGFGCCIQTMNLDPVTAKVLDELQFLINAVLALPQQATEVELAKIRVTGSYVYNCILGLGDASPCQAPLQLPPPSHSYSYPATHRPTTTYDRTASTRIPSIVLTDEGGLGPAPTATARRRPGVQWSTSSPILSLSYATTSGRPSSEQQFQQEIPLAPLLKPTSIPAQQPIADPLFPTIRLAALIYASAITNRQSFRSIVTEDDFNNLWQAFWKVPLSRWKEVLGVSNWILVPFLPIARGMKQGRIVKNMVFNGLFTMAIEDWEVATRVMERTEGLRMWLAGGEPG